MPVVPAELSARERAKPDLAVCGSCLHKPYPTYVVWDLPGVGRVAACSDPTNCRLRAQALGTWCTYEPMRAAA